MKMKKKIIYYSSLWLIVVVVFNLTSFVLPRELNGMNKYGGSFWVGYVFIMLTLVGHLLFSILSFMKENENNKAVNIVMSYINMGELLIMFIVGSVCMYLPNLPNWAGIVGCSLVLLVSIVYSFSAKMVSENVQLANQKVNDKTKKMRELINKTELLCSKSSGMKEQEEIKKLYEKIRYSELCSYPETEDDEREIEQLLEQLNSIIESKSNMEEVEEITKKIISVIQVRNNKCHMIIKK